MIPSLSGALYKFDGETVEPIPINADNLLSSSFKFSDDLVISGKLFSVHFEYTFSELKENSQNFQVVRKPFRMVYQYTVEK